MTSTSFPDATIRPVRALLFLLGAAVSLAACGQDARVVSQPLATAAPTTADAPTTSAEPKVEPPAPAVDEDELVSLQVHPIDELVVDPASATIVARFQGALGDCTGYRIGAETIGDEIIVTLLQGLHPNAAAMTCPAGLEPRELTVELAEPVGDREVYATDATDSRGDEMPADDSGSAGLVLDPADFVGLAYGDAVAKAELEGWTARLVRSDDEYFLVTEDFRPDRLNFEIDDDIVTSVVPG